MIAHTLVLVCWTVFLVYWFVSACSTKRTTQRQSPASDMAHKIPVTLGAILLFVPIPFPPLNALVVPPTPVAQIAAVGSCALGLFGALWARRTLAGNWSDEVVLKEEHELVERGPYRFARHPIYTSLLLMVFGTVIAVGRLASFLGFLAIVVGLCVKLKQEEALLLRQFPDEYAAYRARVKALLPFVW